MNKRSSTDSECFGADDMSTIILWKQIFMEAKGVNADKNILYQDNKGTILLEENGKGVQLIVIEKLTLVIY